MFCCTLLYVHSSFTIILVGKSELVALLSLSSWCLVMVLWFFLAVQWVWLRLVVVVFPDHTHLLFFIPLQPMFNVCRAVDVLKPAFVSTYIVYIFGKIELLSIHAYKIVSK